MYVLQINYVTEKYSTFQRGKIQRFAVKPQSVHLEKGSQYGCGKVP